MQTKTQKDWFESILGQLLLGYEQSIYDHAVSDVFGFYAVQVGLPQIDCLKSSRIPHVITAGKATGHIHCESDYLPFAESSIDLLCMPHALEFSDNPHQALREAARVLVPEGYLIMTGFNPFSFWGLKRLLKKKAGYPWGGQFFSLLRIKDWLALLGMEFVEAEFFCHELPVNNEAWLKRFSFVSKIGAKWWPMLGGQYVIVAKKRVVNIALLELKWTQRLLKPGLAVSGQKTRIKRAINKIKLKVSNK